METPISSVTEVTNPVAVAERYRAAIYRYILRMVSDPEHAEDLTQETLLRAHQRSADLRDPAALESWLYRIATNICHDAFRQSRPLSGSLKWTAGRAAQEPLLPDETRLEPDQLLEQNAMSDCVSRFLAGLPDAERAVLLLHDLHGYTNPEIAGQLQCSLPTVKIRLHRARARLRDTLTQACEFSRDRRGAAPKPSPTPSKSGPSCSSCTPHSSAPAIPGAACESPSLNCAKCRRHAMTWNAPTSSGTQPPRRRKPASVPPKFPARMGLDRFNLRQL